MRSGHDVSVQKTKPAAITTKILPSASLRLKSHTARTLASPFRCEISIITAIAFIKSATKPRPPINPASGVCRTCVRYIVLASMAIPIAPRNIPWRSAERARNLRPQPIASKPKNVIDPSPRKSSASALRACESAKNPQPRFSPPNTSSRNVINNASMMFTRTDTDNTVVIIKAISGMVATMGGNPQISEILTHIVKKRYAYDASNIYNAAIQENWVALAAALVSLVQKLYMDQDDIIAQLEKIVGKQATQQFARQWKQQQVPFVGATMMAGNMLNSIKGIITPSHLK